MRVLPKGRKAWLRALVVIGTPMLVAVVGSCYMTSMPGRSHAGLLPPLTAAQGELAARLRGHVTMLAETVGPRCIWRVGSLEQAAQYIEGELRTAGYTVAAQDYPVRGRDVRNLEAEIPGRTHPREILIVGAHYDSVGGCPGANDNASGVAAVLEVARSLAGREFRRTVRFVAFANEEPPFFQTEEMGSRVYARRCRERGEDIIGAIVPETIGYYRDVPGSQKYPFPFSVRYPDEGNFIAFVGNLSSRRLVRTSVGSFRRHTAFPSEGAAVPGWLTGAGWSDHWSFWQEGYPGLMVTDTAPFRYPHYHERTDTVDKLDFERMARVVEGLSEVVADLAGPCTQEASD